MTTIAFFKDIRPVLEKMSDADVGQLMKALFAWADGEEVDAAAFSPNVDLVFPFIADQTARLNKIRQARSYAGSKHGTKQEQNETNEEQNANKRVTPNPNPNPNPYIYSQKKKKEFNFEQRDTDYNSLLNTVGL